MLPHRLCLQFFDVHLGRVEFSLMLIQLVWDTLEHSEFLVTVSKTNANHVTTVVDRGELGLGRALLEHV